MLPVPEGYGPARPVADERTAHALRISGAATLADLARDYAIFSHAAFFTHGGLDVDPVADYAARQAGEVVAVARFGRRVLAGLGDHPLAETLLFSPHAEWPALRDVLRTCAWVDRTRGRYACATAQELPMVDFLATDRTAVLPTPLPTVPITLFGVDGTHVHFQFRARVTHPLSRPEAVRLCPTPRAAAIGRAILGGSSRPFRAIESEDPLAGQESVVRPPA